MRGLIHAVAAIFGFRPDYATPFTLDTDFPGESAVGPNGMIQLVPGRTLIVEGGLDRPPTFVGEGEAGPNPFSGMTLPNKHEVNEHIPGGGFLPHPGRTAFTLWVEEGGPSSLLVENANDTPVVYMTHLVEPRGDGLVIEPTVTCAVAAKGGGVESRPDPVTAAYIVGMRAVPYDDLCYDAATGRMRRLRRRVG